ncbi:aromatic-ring-hydroxylating dioxygenase subunit beta [Paraburkholderia unamae]|uniref:3-phenylpropionate/cinnamic acid dioxygenase small subunit n=1 Tax=Paraburkholderia unamae TaxID=219649 RepID=A0ABX5K8A4_9BURK|nr:aromatic-ring-hydroxylating dioxygenase subunit beta [Paraburkholderia unamae]PVX70768.1 3-phenylpropionate/cinnamic acid dioxygenase small subunit [Paraburkholderia unamae]CAG9251589.1 Phenylpropionate dioxygenase small subunit [Paraburkholderia unamae]
MNVTDHLGGDLGEAIVFIWKEAELLDRKRYEAWAALWTEEGIYVVPTDAEATDFTRTLNYAFDDARMRKMRLARMTSGAAISADSAAATVRTVSRFTLGAVQEDSFEVDAAQIVTAYKRESYTTFIANVTYRLCRRDGALKLERKIVRLINAADSLDALGFLL